MNIMQSNDQYADDTTLAPEQIKPGHAKFVGSIPEMYDRHLGPLLFEFSAADIAERIARHQPDARRVLEVACGTGICTDHLWRNLNPEVQILATDLNDAMLDHARENRKALTNVTFQQADAQALNIPDNTQDAVVCQFGLMFFPDKAVALSEFARVLKPGGTLALNVWDDLTVNKVAGIAKDVIAGFFEDNAPDFLTVPFGYSDLDPIRRLVQGAGLEKLEFAIVETTVERPSAVSVARGFVEGNPGILQIREHEGVDEEEIIAAVARAYEDEFGPDFLQIPLREIVVLAQKPLA